MEGGFQLRKVNKYQLNLQVNCLLPVSFSYINPAKAGASLFHALEQIVGWDHTQFTCLAEVSECETFVADIQVAETSVIVGVSEVRI